MLSVANNESRLRRTVEIAFERLNKINQILLDLVETLFEGKTPVEKPHLLMAMGGAGSGKTAVEEMAKACCGENFVTASLDEFRKLSDLYRVMTAAGHHSDDYVFIEPFANRLRDLVAERACQEGINLLYDGTAIPYRPRYARIVNQFKSKGFYTSIIAVDAFLIKPAGREVELSREAVVGSVKNRFDATGRALPWVVTVDKHIRAPRAFLEALQDLPLDKIALFANDGDKDRHYLVAESYLMNDEEVRELQNQQLSGVMKDYLENISTHHKTSVLNALARQDTHQVDEWLSRNPNFAEKNLAYQLYRGTEINRTLLIFNTARWVDFIQKTQLNPNASGEEGLLHKSVSLAFHVDPRAPSPWIVRLQESQSA
jgi:hypothetical protein